MKNVRVFTKNYFLKNVVLKKLPIFVILSLALSVLGVSNLYAEGQSGVIVDLFTGYAQLALPTASTVAAQSFSQHPWGAYRFGLGYVYYFTHHFGLGIEAGRGDYGSATYRYVGNTVKIHDTTAEFTFRPEVNIKNVTLYGRVGGTRNTTTFYSDLGNTTEQRQNMLAGVGIDYAITQHINLGFDFQHDFGKKLTNVTNPDWLVPAYNSYMFGIMIRFFPNHS